MGGPAQHNIPQFFLRGFRVRSSSQARSEVWQFEKGKAPKLSLIKDDVAVEEPYFYSTPSTDGSRTLDEQITNYENSFANLVHTLRATPLGAPADSAKAAEVVAHLTIRNAHLRRNFLVEG